jgi:hypothetical protein
LCCLPFVMPAPPFRAVMSEAPSPARSVQRLATRQPKQGRFAMRWGKMGTEQLRYGATVLAFLAPLCWFGWTSWPDRVLDDPTTAATAFLNDLTAGQVEVAYARTTRDFRTRHSLAQLRDLLQQDVMLQAASPSSGAASGQGHLRPCSADPGAWSYQIQGTGGAAILTLKLVVEEGRWRVSSCLVQITQSDGRSGQPAERTRGRCVPPQLRKPYL